MAYASKTVRWETQEIILLLIVDIIRDKINTFGVQEKKDSFKLSQKQYYFGKRFIWSKREWDRRVTDDMLKGLL